MSTTGGRQTIRFAVPAYGAHYAGYPVDTADLIHRNGIWWLHVVVSVPAPEVEPTDEVVGVDLGLAQPAVTSMGFNPARPETLQRTDVRLALIY
jgi:hypothetical protein